MPRPVRGAYHDPARRPGLEIAEIFRTHGDAYRQAHALSREQRAVMRAIEVCRTAVLGGHLDVCDRCGYQRPAYNSCRNRHCPKCQSLAQARWIEQRMARTLETHYFHVVFSLPSELRSIALVNRRKLFAILFAAASQALLALGRDPGRLGATLGITAVLHTWTRDLQFHPHLHCIVTGGGLALDGERWTPARGKYLFPVKVLSRLFRGKLLAALARAYRRGQLVLSGPCSELVDPVRFARLRHRLYRKEWVVYAKRPFAGVAQVFRYLGRYTHRVALSNQRLQAVDDQAVRFATKNGQSATLGPHDFIRRFLLHVLPARFVKIRHYGLLAPHNATSLLDRARRHLAATCADKPASAIASISSHPDRDWRVRLRELTGLDLSRCPICTTGTMIRRPLIRGAVAERAPPRQAA